MRQVIVATARQWATSELSSVAILSMEYQRRHAPFVWIAAPYLGALSYLSLKKSAC